jgi:hypothetical protein
MVEIIASVLRNRLLLDGPDERARVGTLVATLKD